MQHSIQAEQAAINATVTPTICPAAKPATSHPVHSGSSSKCNVID